MLKVTIQDLSKRVIELEGKIKRDDTYMEELELRIHRMVWLSFWKRLVFVFKGGAYLIEASDK